jgi:peptidyl-prolyl cis-trans isomerase A (cyclophilin A)
VSMKKLTIFLALCLSIPALGASDSKGKNPVATIKTSAGTITLTLFKDKAPKTVENFIGLATGKKEWKDPKTGKAVKNKSLYAGTIFHRVIPGFMIQGGDPLGQGVGGPGYQFEDEFDPLDSFNKPGILAMANAGPNTNGSQFFITVAPTPHLTQRHTIFGEVTRGMDVVIQISKVARDAMDKPLKEVKIESIKIN